jgi:hypothetical protein
MPVIEEKYPSKGPVVQAGNAAQVDDGARPLLKTGFWVLVVGGIAALATKTVFGGVGVHGPHTNSGWMSLIVAMGCLPFGTMLFLLGGAKWAGRWFERRGRR